MGEYPAAALPQGSGRRREAAPAEAPPSRAAATGNLPVRHAYRTRWLAGVEGL